MTSKRVRKRGNSARIGSPAAIAARRIYGEGCGRARTQTSGPAQGTEPVSHYAERLELLQRLADRLETAGVSCLLKRHVPASAPSSPDEETVPALLLGAEVGCVRVLYWQLLGADESRPFFVWHDSVERFAADEPGIDRLAAIIVCVWRDATADQPGERFRPKR